MVMETEKIVEGLKLTKNIFFIDPLNGALTGLTLEFLAEIGTPNFTLKLSPMDTDIMLKFLDAGDANRFMKYIQNNY